MKRTLVELVYYPYHELRHASPTYNRTHKHLIDELDAPCWICGVRKSDGGKMETHHARFEWAAQFGLDLDKVTRDFPEITDRAALAEWVDSEVNMLVLCAAHHRGRFVGIHEITFPCWQLQRYQGDGWTFIEQGEPRAHTPLFA